MRSRWGIALVCAAAVSLSFAGAASAERPVPSWFNAQQVHNAGAAGMTVGEEALNTECPGVQGPGVTEKRAE